MAASIKAAASYTTSGDMTIGPPFTAGDGAPEYRFGIDTKVVSAHALQVGDQTVKLCLGSDEGSKATLLVGC